MQMVLGAARFADQRVRLAAYACLCEISELYYKYLEPFMGDLFQLTGAAIKQGTFRPPTTTRPATSTAGCESAESIPALSTLQSEVGGGSESGNHTPPMGKHRQPIIRFCTASNKIQTRANKHDRSTFYIFPTVLPTGCCRLVIPTRPSAPSGVCVFVRVRICACVCVCAQRRRKCRCRRSSSGRALARPSWI